MFNWGDRSGKNTLKKHFYLFLVFCADGPFYELNAMENEPASSDSFVSGKTVALRVDNFNAVSLTAENLAAMKAMTDSNPIMVDWAPYNL